MTNDYIANLNNVPPTKATTKLNHLTTNGVESLRDLKQLIRIARRDTTTAFIVLKHAYQNMSKDVDPALYELCVLMQERAFSKYMAEQDNEEHASTADSLIADLLANHYTRPKDAELIEGTPFYKNCLNTVFGMSKSGKSFSTAQLLAASPIKKTDMIWLDADYNVNKEFISMLHKDFIHLNSNIRAVEDKLLSVDGNGKVLIFDSLKDFTQGVDIDSNSGAQQVMEYIREFTKANYTVILIAHATKDKDIGIKIKGNSETITSKSDIVFRLNKNDSFRELEITASRLSGVYSGDSFKLYDLIELKESVEAIITSSEKELTVRELRNKIPSSVRATFTSNIDQLIHQVKDGKKLLAKCIQKR